MLDILRELATVLIELGLGLSAYRLANVLKGRVENHETRIVRLESPGPYPVFH